MMENASGGYSLSPLQAGMLYQSLLAEGALARSGYDIEQIRISCNEQFNIASFEQAWNELIGRYEVLTNRFQWKEGPQPEQIPCAGVRVPLQILDWTRGDAESLRAEFLLADRIRGFKLDEPPLMRVTLAQLPHNRCEVFWTIHHILVDERSFTWLLYEVFGCYAERVSGSSAPASRSDPPFRAYTEWLEKCDFDKSRDFFKLMLEGKRSPTPLPLAEPVARPLTEFGYGTTKKALNDQTYRALSALANQHGVEMSVVVMAAWAVMMARLTGDDDVIFGITRTCRYSALEGVAASMIGLLINTLPARFKVNDDADIGQFLEAVRQRWVAQWGHEHMSLVQLQALGEMGPGVPLFETLVMYKNRDLNSELRKYSNDWLQRECELYEQPSVPLTLIATDVQDLEFRLLFDRRRYSLEVAQRLLSYLDTVLNSMAQGLKVADIEIMPVAERQQVVYGWNSTERSFDDKKLIHQLFESRAESIPDAVAVQVGDASYTFAEVELRANRLANALRHQGIQQGQYVGVCLSRDIGLVVALLGIAKSGAAYLPIDPEAPRDRIAFMTADANVQLVVTEPAYRSLFDCAVLDQADAEVIQASGARPTPATVSTAVCYAIFTSGSTGKPKGVVLTHRAVVNTLEWVSRTFDVKPGDRALFVTSPCFDLSVYDVFGILGAGATVVVATSDVLAEPRRLVRLLIDQRISIWDSAPAALQRLTAVFPTEVTAANGVHLRLAMLSGDWIPLALPDVLCTTFTNVRVMSLGGATEAAIWSNWFAIGEVDRRWNSIPYGRPIQNAQYYVLDKRRRPVPVGVTGDLYISGTCLAEGYLNRPELTQERFVPNPFRLDINPGERMYMTGDLARFFPDGNLEFLGRADFQVKIRGYRIELGEIEAALAGLAGVSAVICVAYDDTSGAKALAAYVTFKHNMALDETLIKDSLRKVLPDYMVPARIIKLDAMPLSANGKLDRKALPSPLDIKSAAKDYIEPKTETEKRLVSVWQRVLKVDRIGMSDNFFALGGDSLSAVLLAVEIEKEFAANFPLARVLEHPTPRTMTTVLGRSVAKNKHLVSLNAQGSRVPLVLFSGIGGFGFFFHNLAERLGSDQPVHVLHSVGAEDDAEGTHHTIEEMADIYAPQIVAACPQETLILGGYSFGALFAYELAGRLTKLGKKIPFIVSFDGTAPGHPRRLPLVPRLLRHVTDWLALGFTKKIQYLQDRYRNLRLRVVGLEKDDRFLPMGVDSAMAERIARVTAGLWRARDMYKPTNRIQCDLLLFKAEVPFEWPGCVTDEVYGWREFVSGTVRIVDVEGEHLRLFSQSNNSRMASAINEQLASVLAFKTSVNQ
jgi:amino acid adenylation domain-containing protein